MNENFIRLFRADGWANLLTGLGISGRDKTKTTTHTSNLALDRSQLQSMYHDSGIVRRIVELHPSYMLREWITIPEDTDGIILEQLGEAGVKSKIMDGLTWGRLFGGAMLVLGVKDGGSMEDPVNMERAEGIDFVHVFDRHKVTWTSADLYTDPNNKKFNTPEYYHIHPIQGNPFTVHESRCIRFGGARVTEERKVELHGWSESVLTQGYDSIKNLGSAFANTGNIIEDFVTGVLTIQGLTDMIASGQEGLVQQRLHLMDLSRHVINTTLLDTEEQYEKKTTTVTGLPEILDRFMNMLAADYGIPVTLLMGEAPAGLNATGDSDIRNFYDTVAAMQEDILYWPISYMIQLSTKGRIKSFEFNPLWQPTDKDIVDARKVQAEIDQIYINTGVLDSAEVAISRFGGENYSYDTILDMSLRAPDGSMEEEESAEEEMAEEEDPTKEEQESEEEQQVEQE